MKVPFQRKHNGPRGREGSEMTATTLCVVDKTRPHPLAEDSSTVTGAGVLQSSALLGEPAFPPTALSTVPAHSLLPDQRTAVFLLSSLPQSSRPFVTYATACRLPEGKYYTVLSTT